MPYYLKVAVSALIITLTAELAKRSTLAGAILISLPLNSLLALCWLYNDTKDIEQVMKFSTSVVLLVLPSLAFFVLLNRLIAGGQSFWPALAFAVAGTALTYWIYATVLAKFGVNL
jgi:hypothetical protein